MPPRILCHSFSGISKRSVTPSNQNATFPDGAFLIVRTNVRLTRPPDVSTNIVTNSTHQDEIAQRADSFNTTGDELVSTADVVVALIVVFALFAIVFFVVKGMKRKAGSGSGGL